MEISRRDFLTIILALSAIAFPTCQLAAIQDDQREFTVRLEDTDQQLVTGAELCYFDGKIGKNLRANDQGLFDVRSAPGLIIAKADGFQFTGTVVKGPVTKDQGDEKLEQPLTSREITLTLRRLDEPGQIKQTLPIPLDRDQQKKLRDYLCDRLLESLAESRDTRTQVQLVSTLVLLQPESALEFLTDSHDLPQQAVVAVKLHLVPALAQSDPEVALELIADVPDPRDQSLLFRELLQALPVESPMRASIEDQWLLAIQQVGQPQFKFGMIALLAAHFRKTDQHEKASRLIATSLEQVEQLPSAGWSAFPRSLIAAQLVTEDAVRAEKIVSAVNPGSDDEAKELNRAWYRLAFHSCADLELTNKFLSQLGTLESENQQFSYRFRVLQKLAVHHPQQACELARAIPEINWRAWTLGIIAGRINQRDPSLARQTIDAAVQATIDTESPDNRSNVYHPAVTLAGLIPVAEKVAPDQVESMLWQAAWLAIPRSRFSATAGQRDAVLQQVSAALCRYDRELGLALFADREITDAFSRDGGASSAIVLRPTTLQDFIEFRAAESHRDLANSIQTLLSMIAAEDNRAWDQVSLPIGLEWQSDEFESE